MQRPKKEQHSNIISGHTVLFPYKPYPSQLVMMERVIKSLCRGENALLESATGTGKSLALLCGSLSWQLAEKQRMIQQQGPQGQAAEEEDENIFLQSTTTTTYTSSTPSTPSTPTPSKSSISPTTTPSFTSPSYESETIPASTTSNSTATAVPSTSSVKKREAQSNLDSSTDNDVEIIEKKPKTDHKPAIAYDDDDDFQPDPTYKKINTKKAKKSKEKTKGKQPATKAKLEKDLSTPKKPGTTTSVPTSSPPLQPDTPLSTPTPSPPSQSAPAPNESPPPHNPSAKPPKVKAPTIYFGTRTHTQVAQLVGELRNTAYRPRMCILAARDHYCINPAIMSRPNKNHECKKLQRAPSGCTFRSAEGKLANQGSLVSAVWDIEDLVQKGKSLHACPFFASRSIAKKADIVFCPYNYIIDPAIRESLGINLKGNIVIFDEAHNIEDAMMNVASGDFDLADLQDELLQQLNTLVHFKDSQDVYKPLQQMIASVVHWMMQSIGSLLPVNFENHSNAWSGGEFVEVLRRGNVTVDNFDIIASAASAAGEFSETSGVTALSPKAVLVLSSFVKIVRFLLSEELLFVNDFQVVIQKVSSHSTGRSVWTYSLGVWCLNPRVGFQGLSEIRSAILTSGTLAPMDSYESELATKFPLRAELGHVINTQKQVWVGTIAQGPSGDRLNTTFKFSDTFAVQDAIGESILAYAQKIPNGVLCFFQSYAFLEKVTQRWESTGLWAKLRGIKSIHTEPKSSGTDFSTALAKYYKAAKSSSGAILFAVCRGKHESGPTVYVVSYLLRRRSCGLPTRISYFFVPIIFDVHRKDARVVFKQAYNQQNAAKYGLIDGKSWYQLQAFRALNQAIGRCIRHKNDYGAIILMDERFKEDRIIGKISKWARMCAQQYNTFQQSVDSLESFFLSNR